MHERESVEPVELVLEIATPTLREGLKGQEEVVERIIGFSQNLLENTRGGLVAGVGSRPCRRRA